MTENLENNLDRKDLKIQALLEKVSRLTTEKENEIADLRVELTIVSEQLRTTDAELNELKNAAEEKSKTTSKTKS